MEMMLKHNSWIDEAELYFDNRNVLHITLTEKEPIARVFSTTGNSFYIDKIGNKIPLSEKRSARVPVFTGFPELKKMNAATSPNEKFIPLIKVMMNAAAKTSEKNAPVWHKIILFSPIQSSIPPVPILQRLHSFLLTVL